MGLCLPHSVYVLPASHEFMEILGSQLLGILPQEFKKFKTGLDEFQVQPEDTQQIAGYVAGLREEYPEAQISQFVIYCVGNQGFRVFEVSRA